MSDTGNTTGSTEEAGSYTDEHGTQEQVEHQVRSESTVDGDAFGVPAEGEYTDEHGPETTDATNTESAADSEVGHA